MKFEVANTHQMYFPDEEKIASQYGGDVGVLDLIDPFYVNDIGLFQIDCINQPIQLIERESNAQSMTFYLPQRCVMKANLFIDNVVYASDQLITDPNQKVGTLTADERFYLLTQLGALQYNGDWYLGINNQGLSSGFFNLPTGAYWDVLDNSFEIRFVTSQKRIRIPEPQGDADRFQNTISAYVKASLVEEPGNVVVAPTPTLPPTYNSEPTIVPTATQYVPPTEFIPSPTYQTNNIWEVAATSTPYSIATSTSPTETAMPYDSSRSVNTIFGLLCLIVVSGLVVGGVIAAKSVRSTLRSRVRGKSRVNFGDKSKSQKIDMSAAMGKASIDQGSTNSSIQSTESGSSRADSQNKPVSASTRHGMSDDKAAYVFEHELRGKTTNKKWDEAVKSLRSEGYEPDPVREAFARGATKNHEERRQRSLDAYKQDGDSGGSMIGFLGYVMRRTIPQLRNLSNNLRINDGDIVESEEIKPDE